MRYLLCLTTFPNRPAGERAAAYLVRKRLAACVNLLSGVRSFYFWKKRLCRDSEVLLLLKTLGTKVSSLERELKKIHPYELPEFIALPITKGSRRYLNWMKGALR